MDQNIADNEIASAKMEECELIGYDMSDTEEITFEQMFENLFGKMPELLEPSIEELLQFFS